MPLHRGGIYGQPVRYWRHTHVPRNAGNPRAGDRAHHTGAVLRRYGAAGRAARQREGDAMTAESVIASIVRTMARFLLSPGVHRDYCTARLSNL